jgi:hypothetical protein
MLGRFRRLLRSKKCLEPKVRFDFDLLTKTWKCVKTK